jgi:hypothetical protein
MEKPPGNGGSVCGVAGWLALRLDGEGVFEALHALFQVLDLALLLGQEEMFDPVQPDLDSGDVLFGSRGLEALIDHLGQLFNGDFCLCHMCLSITGR